MQISGQRENTMKGDYQAGKRKFQEKQSKTGRRGS
jgi:hypothetical protein